MSKVLGNPIRQHERSRGMIQARSTAPSPVNEPVLNYENGSKERLDLVRELERQKSAVEKIPVLIDGKAFFNEGNTVTLTSPHDHSLTLAEVSNATSEQVHAAITSNLNARKHWASLPWEHRASVFLKAADLLTTKYRAQINAATMLCQSKTAHQAEIDAACELIDFFRFNVRFMEQIFSEQPISAAGMWNRTEVRGLEGFVYAVSPFNFTSIAVNLPAAPALMGCSVLWKPAPTSMLSAWIGMKVLMEAGLPAGVINMIPGDPETISEVVLKNKDLSGLHFTGSTKTFNHLWKQIALNLDNYKQYPRIVGETGGKDFVFAHKSADPLSLATALVRGAFEFQGQKCSAASRAYVPTSIWPEVKSHMSAMLEEITVGDVTDFKHFMGAVIDQRAFDKISGYIKRAEKADDANVVLGGSYDDKKGYFIHPTVIETSNPHYESMVEEIFGPVLTVLPYDDSDFEKTLELCDTSTNYALTGAIFAKDRHVISQMSEALKSAAGNFYINDKPTGAVVGQQPFGGARASGTNDKAGSMLNLLRWCSHRTVKETFNPPTHFAYPYMD